jgi:endoglucanase
MFKKVLAGVIMAAILLTTACGGGEQSSIDNEPSAIDEPQDVIENQPENENEPEDESEPEAAAIVFTPAPPVVLPAIEELTARELTAAIRVGWNLGNTLDAVGSDGGWHWLGDGTYAGTPVEVMEAAWLGGNLAVTQDNFNAIRDGGFNTVRIPVSWYKAADADNNFAIREDWMARVKEVVDYAYSNDMIVILNTHHDETIFRFMDEDMEESKFAFVKIWEQIAEEFKDYGGRLVFEGLNEPRTKGSSNEWRGGTPQERNNVNILNGLFVDTVRASGGNNAYRVLMVPTYAASADAAAMNDLVVPADTAADKIIVSIHAYTPWNFALATGGHAVTEWSSENSSDTNPITNMLDRVYDTFVSQGVPVIMGEMGAMNRDNEEDRADWAYFYVNYAKSLGIPCVWWDNGAVQGGGELFGLLDRRSNEFFYPLIVDAMMRATEQ